MNAASPMFRKVALIGFGLIGGSIARGAKSLGLAAEIDRAAAADGTTVSAWIAETAAHRLRLEAGRRGIAEWEHEHGALTAEELADGLARARAILAAAAPRRRVS